MSHLAWDEDGLHAREGGGWEQSGLADAAQGERFQNKRAIKRRSVRKEEATEVHFSPPRALCCWKLKSEAESPPPANGIRRESVFNRLLGSPSIPGTSN